MSRHSSMEENRNVALTPSQRVHLISIIADRLGDNPGEIIRMTLRQFDFPMANEWRGGTVRAYVIARIQDADDDSLLELGSHLGCEIQLPLPDAIPSSWEDGHFRLFISHLWEHRSFAEQIEAELRHFGISSFIAHKDIEPTQIWQTEIEAALATCDAMLGLLHPGFHNSNWTDQEIGYAMGRQLLVVTVDFGTTPYGFMGKFQAITGIGEDPRRLARRLVEIFHEHPQTRRRMAETAVDYPAEATSFDEARAAVDDFAESPSYSEAKRRMSLLEKLEYWDDAMTAKVRSALEDNSQIAEAWTVPDRLECLIQKWTAPHE